jgi:hypothetical protein
MPLNSQRRESDSTLKKLNRSMPGFACKSWPRDACRRALPAVRQASQAEVIIQTGSTFSKLNRVILDKFGSIENFNMLDNIITY